MQTRQEALRGKIDTLRAAVNAAELDREQAVELLKGWLTNDTDGSTRHPDVNPGATVYMCPWHTCAATRHSPN